MNLSFAIMLSLQLPFSGELRLIDEANNSTKNLLVLGDSHLVGDFGEYLHRELHDLHEYNVTSIGIGGAGSYHFSVTMRNFCCGSKIRETCWFDTVSAKEKMPVTEHAEGATNALVGRFFKGKLENVIAHYDPEVVVIALGSNYTNAHDELLEIVRKGNIQREIIWVGPMLRSNFQMRFSAIQQVMKKYPDIRLIPSHDIVGHDTITSAHYAGKSARNWAEKVVERMESHL